MHEHLRKNLEAGPRCGPAVKAIVDCVESALVTGCWYRFTNAAGETSLVVKWDGHIFGNSERDDFDLHELVQQYAGFEELKHDYRT